MSERKAGPRPPRPPGTPAPSGDATQVASSEFLLYETEDGQTRIDVRVVGDTVWLSLQQLADLFGRDKSVISRHVKNVFDEGELVPGSVVANFATTAADSKTYQVTYYNLDVIISVGYRVKSLRGTQFRIWATQRLREYLVKGFAMDDELLKERGNSQTSRNCWRASAIFAVPRRCSGSRCWRSMPPALTTARASTSRSVSLPPCRTRCTGRRTATQPPKSSPAGPTRASPTWA